MKQDQQGIAAFAAVVTLVIIGLAFTSVRSAPSVQAQLACFSEASQRFMSVWKERSESTTEDHVQPRRRTEARWDAYSPMEGVHRRSKTTSFGKEDTSNWEFGFFLVAIGFCGLFVLALGSFFFGMSFGSRYFDKPNVLWSNQQSH